MTIKKSGNNWLADFRPEGRNGKRVRKQFQTKAEAMRYEAFIMGQAVQGKDWNPSTDKRRLSDLINEWHEGHGKSLRDGARRHKALLAMAENMANPTARLMKPSIFLDYRSQRLNNEISPKTVNNELTYLNAVFNTLESNKIIDFSNPLKSVKPVKVRQTELTYLNKEQIDELLDSIEHPDALLISKICLSTGCRWGEAQNLKSRHIANGQINFTDTKSGKNRSVPIKAELEREIHRHGKGELFGWSLSAFRRALEKTSIELPKGQASHVLRHTFASHFMINGGNIITLQRILGHSSINMTMRYAHLSPDHLRDALNLNPLSNA